MNMQRPSTIFYGWLVVAAAFVITFVGFGSAYTFSAFLDSLQHEFAASRGSVSAVFSLAGFLYFALGIVSAPLADRLGVKALSAIGMTLVGLGLILAGQARTLLQVYAAYSIGVGVGVGCAYVPTLGAVQRWFVERRGLASGLAVSGIGVGTLVMPPFAIWLIAGFGWRSAYTTLGVLAIMVGLAAALVMEDDPSRRGLQPDGIARTMVVGSLEAGNDTPAGQAIRTRRFAGLYLASFLSALGVFVPFVHLAPYALDHGVPASGAVWLLGAIGILFVRWRQLAGHRQHDRPLLPRRHSGQDGPRALPDRHVYRHGRLTSDLDPWWLLGPALTVRVDLRSLLRRVGRDFAGSGRRSVRRAPCRPHHRGALFERCPRHARWPRRGRLHLRSQP